ncbi:hypothetical protein X975_13359, partial [Stegodyphus mimosarum]
MKALSKTNLSTKYAVELFIVQRSLIFSSTEASYNIDNTTYTNSGKNILIYTTLSYYNCYVDHF